MMGNGISYLPVNPCHPLVACVTGGLPGAGCCSVRRRNRPPREDALAEPAIQGGSMKRQVTAALLAAGIAVGICAATAAPAAAATSGSETFSGTIVTSGVSGARTVIHSVIIAKGVFNGVGRIVELPNLPTDPPDVSRDDLVFPGGTMHLVSAGGDVTSFSINPHNCMIK